MSAYRPLAELCEALEQSASDLAKSHETFRNQQLSLYETGASIHNVVTNVKRGQELEKLEQRAQDDGRSTDVGGNNNGGNKSDPFVETHE